MEKKIGIGFIGLILFCVLLTACTGGQQPRWENAEGLLTSEHEGVAYRFDTARWDEEAASKAVENITEFLSVTGVPEGFTVYAGEEADAEAQLWIKNDKLVHADYQALYQAVYGEAQDQVMAYGAAAAICTEKQLCKVGRIYTDAELAEYFSNEDNLYLLDLTLPMIEDKFIDAESAEHARVAAISLAEYCLRERGVEALRGLAFSAVDAPEKTQLKNEWLKAIGANAEYESFALLDYERNDNEYAAEYPYAVAGEKYRFYFSSNDVRSEGYKSFISTYLRYHDLYDQDFAEAQEVLADVIGKEEEKVEIYTNFARKVDIHGEYKSREKRIQLYNDWNSACQVLLHEYVHFLTREQEYVPIIEGLTEAIAVLRCENKVQRAMLSYMAFNAGTETIEAGKESGMWDYETDSPDVRKVNELSALMFYYKTFEDYYSIEMKHFSKVPEEITMNDLAYEAGASFAEYMFELYGIKTVYDCAADTDKLTSLWGKPFEEFYQDWGEWLLQRYIANGGNTGE